MAMQDGQFQDNGTRNLLLGATALMLLAGAVRGYFVYRAHHAPAAVAQQDTMPDSHLTRDDLIFPRNLHAATLADLQQLDGKRVWVQAAGETIYYAGSAKGADLLKPLAYLKGAEPLDVVRFVSQKTPQDKTADSWLVMLFHKAADPKTLLATQVGTSVGKQDNIVADMKFYYDDPHTLYAWPVATWQAVDAHQPLVGMNEFQANLALGQITSTSNSDKGDRSVTYTGNGKPVEVTFVKNRATKITAQ